VTGLRTDFAESVYALIAKIEDNRIKKTKYEAIKSGCILLILPLFCRKKDRLQHLSNDILGVKTRWIRKWESDKKGVSF